MRFRVSFIFGSCALCTDRIKSAFFTNTTGSGSLFFSPDGCVRLVRHFLLFFVKILLFSCTFCQESALKFVCFCGFFLKKGLHFPHRLCIIIIVARSHALAANNIRCSSFTPFSRAFWRRVQYTGYFISRVLMFAPRKANSPSWGIGFFLCICPLYGKSIISAIKSISSAFHRCAVRSPTGICSAAP